MKRRGFTVVELLVGIAIVAILAAVTTIYFGTTRRNSRDAERKADTQTIMSGISQYTVIGGTTFIKYPGLQCVLSNQSNPAIVPSPLTNPGCVGASGRSYGKMNLKNATTDGYSSNAGRSYPAYSIGDALVKGGYLTYMPQDPLAASNEFNNPVNPDYILIRACATGAQQVGSTGTLFGVWTSLENPPADYDKSNTHRYPGGKLAGPENGAGTYVYDFAAQQAEWLDGSYYYDGFAVGNGVTKTVSSICEMGPKPA